MGLRILIERREAVSTLAPATMQQEILSGGITHFLYSKVAPLSVVQFKAEATATHRDISSTFSTRAAVDEGAVTEVALVCWHTPGTGHVVPITDKNRIQRRDFDWQKNTQKKKYPVLKFVGSDRRLSD